MHLDDLSRNAPRGEPPRVKGDGSTRGLVLMGGGARTAYQAGALQALAQLLENQSNPNPQTQVNPFPFQILVGTSAGALNATYLASRAIDGLEALKAWARFGMACIPTWFTTSPTRHWPASAAGPPHWASLCRHNGKALL